MTTDEELAKLEDGFRRLKIDYDIYLNRGSKRPPLDAQWRLDSLLKKLADSSQMSFAQRFRYNAIAQRYALFSDLWRQRLKSREEGPRRTSLDVREERRAAAAFRTVWRDPATEPEKVNQLFTALVEAKRLCGEEVEGLAPDAFRRFVRQKTAQLQHDFQCERVEYIVEVDRGHVKLKAKGA